MAVLKYAPAGRCIYCGAGRHSPSRARLGDEHIVPEALGGRVVLPLACCGRCERAINRFEQPLIRRDFAAIRNAFNFRSKRPKQRPKTVRVEYKTRGGSVESSFPLGQSPVNFAMWKFELAGIFRGEEPSMPRRMASKTFTVLGPFDSEESRKFRQLLGVSPATSVIGNDDNFPLLLAKIAHGTAYGALGGKFGLFLPTLPGIILGYSEFAPSYLIGGMPPYYVDKAYKIEPGKPPTITHQLEVFELEDGPLILCVRIQLFASLNMPSYCVVAAIAPPAAKDMIKVAHPEFAEPTEFR